MHNTVESGARHITVNPRNDKLFFNKNIPPSILYNLGQNLIGTGSAGDVYRVRRYDTYVAVKIVTRKIETDIFRYPKKYESYLESSNQLNEILEMLMPTKHRNILRHFGYGQSEPVADISHFFYVSEWMQNGDLYTFINNNAETPVDMQIKLLWAYGIAGGLAHLHRHGIIHADIKSLNVLIDTEMRVKIGDFDRSQKEGSANQYNGTHRWMAPEIVLHESYNSKASDVYSLATVWWEIFAWAKPMKKYSGCPRLRENKDYLSDVENGVHDPIPGDCPKNIAAYITLGWMQKPELRPTAKTMRRIAKIDMRKNQDIEDALDLALDSEEQQQSKQLSK